MVRSRSAPVSFAQERIWFLEQLESGNRAYYFQAAIRFPWKLFFVLVVIAVFPLMAGYIVLVERKVLADFQVRLGPMRVGPHGLLQPLADALKLCRSYRTKGMTFIGAR